MPNQSKKAAIRRGKEPSGNILIVGVICLAAGLGIGYYFGKSAGLPALPAAAVPQGQAPVMDTAAFLQNEASLKSMISSNPKDLNALIQLGNLYYDNGKFSQAVDYYGKALEIDPGNIGVRTDRGTCYWSLGQADAAIAEFQKSLQINQTHPQTLFNLGIVYLHGKNDANGARNAWEKLLAANPDYPDRARLQTMLTSLAPGATAPPAPAVQPEAPGQSKPGAAGVEDLFKKMKK